jgi:hypothetical protein
MLRRGRRTDDAVSPELRRYVFARDHFRCVVATLVLRGRIRPRGPCRDQYGGLLVGGYSSSLLGLTAAHVRDRAGGRTSKRPPSTPRRLVTACYGHHIADPVVDRPDVREALEEILEKLEGPDPDTDRPHERIRRVRARGVSSSTSDQGGVDGQG